MVTADGEIRVMAVELVRGSDERRIGVNGGDAMVQRTGEMRG